MFCAKDGQIIVYPSQKICYERKRRNSMNKNVKNGALLFSILCAFLLLLGSFGKVSFAEGMGFSWEVKQPDNQRDKTKTYFDLLVKPGEKENLQMVLKNTTDKDLTVLVETNTAVTNDNGVIDYGVTDPKIDATMKYPFGKMAHTEPEVKLAPKEEKTIEIQVDVPTDPFNGIILGGIHLAQKEDGDEESQQSGVQIKNKFAVVVGVRLSENDNPVEADMKLLDVKAGQRNYRNVILANLQNPMPRILSGIKVTADVFAANNTSQPIYHSQQENLQMAPNSNFNYGITMNNKAFRPGKYVLKMVAQADDKEWKFEKEFEIKADEAKKFNDKAVELAEEPKDYTLYIIIAVVVLILVIILVVFWIIHSKRKHELELAKQKRHKGSKKKSNKGK